MPFIRVCLVLSFTHYKTILNQWQANENNMQLLRLKGDSTLQIIFYASIK